MSTAAVPRPPARWTRLDWAIVAGLFAVTLAVFGRAVGYGFIDYDDAVYVWGNRHVAGGLSGANLRWASTAVVSSNWHPLTLYVELALATAFGRGPAAFHAANVLIHAGNVALLYAFLRKSTGRTGPAVAAAALWGWHPLRVESVAWVSELKDVLCGAMWLACLLAYRRYAARRTAGRYAAVALWQLLALLAKPMAVTLPATLLLLDYWPLDDGRGGRRWWARRVGEKLPLLAVSAAAAAVAVMTQRASHATTATASLPVAARVANAAVSYWAYLADVAVPRHLAVVYVHPWLVVGGTVPGLGTVALAAGGLFAVTAAACLFGRSRRRYLAVGWLWFVGVLVPTIGLVQVGLQSRADRYTYVPTIGLTIALVWAVADAVGASRRGGERNADGAAVGTPPFRGRLSPLVTPSQGVAAALGAAAAVVYAAAAAATVGNWRDTRTLFARADEPGNFVAKQVLARDLIAAGGRADEAVALAREAARLAGPKVAGPHLILGDALVARGTDPDLAEANAEYQRAINDDRDDARPWAAIARVYDTRAGRLATGGKPAEAADRYGWAIHCFEEARKLDPDDPMVGDQLAFLLALRGRLPEAVAVWRDVVRRTPDYPQAQGDLGDALQVTGDFAGAVAAYRAALVGGSTDPRWQAAFARLVGSASNPAGSDLDLARTTAEAAVAQTHGTDPLALDALGLVLARTGAFDPAVDRATAARRAAELAKRPDLVANIDRHLAWYRRGEPYVVGRATTAPG